MRMRGDMLSVGTLAVVVMLLMCVFPVASQAGTSPVPRDDAPGKGSLMDVIYQTVMKLVPNPFTVRICLYGPGPGIPWGTCNAVCSVLCDNRPLGCFKLPGGRFSLFFLCCMIQITTSDISARCRPADVENAASKAHQDVRRNHIPRVARARRLGTPFH